MKRSTSILTVAAGLALIAAAPFLGGCESQHDLTPAERATAELGARQYAGSNSDLVGTPSGLDSNNDGYVTATIRDRQTGQTKEIVCSYRAGAAGCKSK